MTGILPGSRSPGYTILSISALLIFWQVLADEIVRNHFILPSFTDVIIAFYELLFVGTLPMDFAVSMIHFFIGLGFSLLSASLPASSSDGTRSSTGCLIPSLRSSALSLPLRGFLLPSSGLGLPTLQQVLLSSSEQSFRSSLTHTRDFAISHGFLSKPGRCLDVRVMPLLSVLSPFPQRCLILRPVSG